MGQGLTSSLFPAIVDPMAYPGGKNGAGVYQRIICGMPPHQVYIEPFLGGGAIARLKSPAALNIAMDLHRPAVDAFEQFLELASSALASSADATRSGDARSPIVESGGRRRHAPSAAMLPAAAPVWEVGYRDGLEYLENLPPHLARGALVYCDPPYLMETRSSGRLYEHEMSDVDHQRLLRWAIATPCRVMISGYWSKMYGSALRKWRCSRFWAMTRGGMAEECLWANFPEPAELHDYRYLGEGFRERERIKRKKSRWVARLQQMPLLERRCLLSAIAETADRGDTRS
jgi:DNA adenine methylase